MLEELEIRSLGPIRHAVVNPARGMTAITGETGAGKSMLLNALRLISGGTVSARTVSEGDREAWAQGVFDVTPGSAVGTLAQDAGAELDDDGLFLSRTLPAQGRSRAVLNGRSVPRSVLRDLTDQLVAIHGQADQLRMASPARQREFLDSYTGDVNELDAYRAAWKRLNDCDAKLRAITEQESETMQRADYLRESIDRIDRVDPHDGEDTELKAMRDRIENSAAIMQGVGGALAALDPGQMGVDSETGGALAMIEQAVHSLQSIGVHGTYDETAERLGTVETELSDIVFTLGGMLEQEDGEGDLDQINGRIHDLDELTRRWGPTLADVIAWREKAGYELEDLDASPERVAQLTRERDAARAAAVEAAERLGERRREAAGELAEQVTGELESLAMSGARLDIEVERRADDGLDAHGGDDIRFLFTAFPGAPRLPMGKSASGGELSRLMLALELSAAQKGFSSVAGQGMTFVFDEVDAGVGGRTAAELGRRLARLAENAQVIVVTHLAQVAAWADAQFVVSKHVAGSKSDTASADADTVTTVDEVRDDMRVHEIARMLDGGETETSLTHARELLDACRL
ncbi:DNA repair protein RecN [Bifidobacterium vansinderenii]|uniref:DNA repair protein RecN n=1 Tax=Bifidobacterium vansinderenii TaxID=1984871 RepID=A0A229VY09_9BIFI|nr:DNA repair protein RecN [Bifidobacterium vansinderenii]OXN00504.1 DNA repair protein RecN [Bifidobacterium vansinderenii]